MALTGDYATRYGGGTLGEVLEIIEKTARVQRVDVEALAVARLVEETEVGVQICFVVVDWG